MVGPSLFRIIGKDIASENGYAYSDAIKSYADGDSGIKIWSKNELTNFLLDPQKVVKGSTMALLRELSKNEIQNILLYLESYPLNSDNSD